jgi:RHS repeat-associated protein
MRMSIRRGILFSKARNGLRALVTVTAVFLAFHASSLEIHDNGRTEAIDKFGETTTFEYDEASRPEKMIYDTGAYALHAYDGRNRIKAIEHKNSSHTLLRKETNVYDPASRITSRYEGPASGGVTTTFTYDDVGQLTGESSSGYSASYTYDANGNRTNRTVNGVSETYTVDDSDKLTSVTWSSGGNNYEKNYSYHYSGRPTSIVYETNNSVTATETMTWDKESRMLTNSLANSSYVYNGFDTRVSKTVSSTTTTFKRAGADPVSPVLSNVAGSTTTNYLPSISSRTGSTSTFSHSGIKNGILQTNSSQSNTAAKRYDAFGNELSTSGTWQTRFDYGGGLGYQRDDESGYKLLGHRYYDPEIGRFLTRDLVKAGRNWYAYCESNPITGADPNGLLTVSLFGEEYEFSWDVVKDGLTTGLHAAYSAYSETSAGLANTMVAAHNPALSKLIKFEGYNGGAHAGDPGFAESKMMAQVGLTALELAAGGGGVAAKAACFAAGTRILMADGSTKPIEDICIGDRVLTRDQFADSNGITSIGIVKTTFVRNASSTITIGLSDGTEIMATPEHPVYVLGLGFTAASSLRLGDELAGAVATLKITSLKAESQATRVFNFEVSTGHTYFVASEDDAIWVHNRCLLSFVPGRWLPHFEKHGAEFGYKTSVEYLQGANKLVRAPDTISKTVGKNTYFYQESTNGFAVVRGGKLRTYFRPDRGRAHYEKQ